MSTGQNRMTMGVLTAVLMALSPLMASAQTGAPAAQQGCDAAPSEKTDRLPNGGEPLTKKLESCGGVLNAPQTGDPGIVSPAPDTGNARVIDPDSVPAGANPSNGASVPPGSGG